mmetsp:Transcript_51568/g.85442  ORF Transcript_51568/g.85442 Transcript_51568/m.85442 type:complete len:109 (+) Transcript_51568:38-364(+)|eukprot:CAMPEP_0202707770 /NCGR_PEP_ID=MMETSP1385-20130828/20058_1 /ASSEMBLY_ACC=CAM_ASM_000861 /TAXON_ID=933848 /ORGANISM="Elphidium margaritaceum" /LENGTH=108 /DNA_ID=CAMNT_0049366555 /DNA_START=27 /DNA_END=353 /DNA_ORIENTATION=-
MSVSPAKERDNHDETEKEPPVDVQIIQNTLSPELLKETLDLTKKYFQECRVEKDVASKIKKAFDEKIFGSTWHCVIGKHFACSVQFDTQYFIFFKFDQHYVLLFKSED